MIGDTIVAILAITLQIPNAVAVSYVGNNVEVIK